MTRLGTVAVLVCFAALATVHTYPLVAHLATHVPHGLGDPVFMLATLEWERSSLLHEPVRFFDGHTYYGAGGTLFFSHLMLGGLLLYAPVATLTGHPLLAFNLTYLGSLTLTAWFAYLAARALLRDRVAAVATGLLWAFALPQLGLHVLPHVTMTWGLPLMLWTLVGFLRRPAVWQLAAATALLWLVFFTDVYVGFMAGMLFLLVAVCAAAGRALPWPLLSRRAALAGATIVVVTLPFVPLLVGYQDVPRRWSEVRPLSEARSYAAEPLDYLVPGTESRWYGGWLPSHNARPSATHRPASQFPGLVPVILGAVGLVWAVRGGARNRPVRAAATPWAVAADAQRRRKRAADTTGADARSWAGAREARVVPAVAVAAALALAAGFVLSLGPELIWRDRPTGVTLPYAWLYGAFAPVRSLRAVSRFVFLVGVGLAMLAGVGVAAIRAYVRPDRRWPAVLAGIAIAAAAVEPWQEPIQVHALTTAPRLSALLRSLPRAPLIFVPVDGPPSAHWHNTRRMFWVAVAGGHPMVGGASGLTPATYYDFARLVDSAQPGTIAPTLEVLRAGGVRYVILERQLVNPDTAALWSCTLASDFRARVLSDDPTWLVADLHASVPRTVGMEHLRARLLHERAPPAAGLLLSVHLAASDGAVPWLQADPPAAPMRALTLTWLGSDGAPVLAVPRRAVFPTFLAAGETAVVEVHAFTPAQAGDYLLAAAVDGRPWARWPLRVAPAEDALRLPAAPGGLGGRLLPIRVTREVFSGQRVFVDLVAENTGRTLWDGSVRLGYRWYAAEGAAREPPASPALPQPTGSLDVPGRRELQDLGGRLYLERDVPPGTSIRFSGHIATPPEPGAYRLFLSLVAETIIWLDEMRPPGAQPLFVDVTVQPSASADACR